jgi:hypothetical protein
MLAFALASTTALSAPLEDAVGGAGPPIWVFAGLRTNVFVSEEMDPDLMARLAQPGVVLWVKTGSNTLRPSLLERLGLFREVYVQQRTPLEEEHLAQFSRLPRVGLWLELGPSQKGLARVGGRPLALQVNGGFGPDVADAARALRPALLVWHPSEDELTLAGWGWFASAPFTKLLWPTSESALPWSSCDAPALRALTRAFVLTPWAPGTERRLPLCGVAAVVAVKSDVGDEALAQLLAADPGAELQLWVGRTRDEALLAASFLSRLGAARGSQ